MNRLLNGDYSVGASESKMRPIYETWDPRFIKAWENNRLVYATEKDGIIVNVEYPIDLLKFNKKDGLLVCWPLNPDFTGKSVIIGILNAGRSNHV